MFNTLLTIHIHYLNEKQEGLKAWASREIQLNFRPMPGDEIILSKDKNFWHPYYLISKVSWDSTRNEFRLETNHNYKNGICAPFASNPETFLWKSLSIDRFQKEIENIIKNGWHVQIYSSNYPETLKHLAVNSMSELR